MYHRRLQEAQRVRVEPRHSEPHVYFHSDRFNQPNDMAIAPMARSMRAIRTGAAATARFGGSCADRTEKAAAK